MKVPNQYRVKSGALGSDDTFGNNGLFIVPFKSFKLQVIASDGEGWEHASVSLPNRCPNWEEMCFIKDLFWGEDKWVVQFHPPKSEYVNNHPYCLHLWKPIGRAVDTPPSILVGIKELKPEDIGVKFCGICGSTRGFILSKDKDETNDKVKTYKCVDCGAPEMVESKNAKT